MLIAIEGVDGAGKRTLTTGLRAAFTGAGKSVVTLAFPRYGQSVSADLAAEALRGAHGDLAESVYAMAVLFALDRAAARAEIADFGGRRTLIVERFDRRWTGDNRLLRLPQEDFCQALSIPPTRKYQSDNGPGIAKDRQSAIFDPFYTTKPPGRGTGLGLNIVYRILTKYRGQVSVESAEGEGTTFTVSFPLESPAEG